MEIIEHALTAQTITDSRILNLKFRPFLNFFTGGECKVRNWPLRRSGFEKKQRILNLKQTLGTLCTELDLFRNRPE